MEKNLNRLRIVGFLEGLSFLLLLGVGMPLKYYWEMPAFNKVMGMAHGVLFVVYCAMVLIVANEQKWEKRKVFLALVASVLPFGPFVADKRLFQA